MKAPDCIQCVCKNYRDLFDSDEAMAESLRMAPKDAVDLTQGAGYPTLDAMIEIQSALRKAALEAERQRQLF